MKILITGASGRLGNYTINAFKSTYDLTLLSNDRFNIPGASCYLVDLSNSTGLEDIFKKEKPDVVIHLAALVGPACESDATLAKKINVDGTRSMARLASKYSVKTFLFASSASIYNQTELEPTNEESNIGPVSEYGKSKLAAEEVLRELALGSTTSYVALRIFNIYGLGFSNSLINRLVKSTPGQPVELLGPDNYYRDYIHATDVVEAFNKLINAGLKPNFTVLNIASGVSTNNSSLIKAILAKGLKPSYKAITCPTNISWADISKAEALINFKPKKELVIDA